MSEARSLGSRAVGAASWVFAARMGVRAIGLVSIVILARLLTPEDFGLVAVAMGMLGILEALTEFDFHQSIVRIPQPTREDYDTAWTLNAIRGVLASLLVLAVAVPFAHLMEDPRVLDILLVLAISPVLGGLQNPRFVDFEKDLSFRPTFVMMVAVKFSAFLVTMAVAFFWRSYWALILGTVASVAARVAISFCYRPQLPRFCLASTAQMLGFSVWMTGATVLKALQQRVDSMIVKKLLSTELAGFFYVAKELSFMLFTELSAPLRRVLYPALSSLQDRPETFRQGYLESVGAVCAVMFPAGVGLALVAPDAVPVLLGDQWDAAIVPMQILALMHSVLVIGSNGPVVVMALGNTRAIFLRNAAVVPVALVAVYFGAQHWGLAGAVAGYGAGAAVMQLIDVALVRRAIGAGWSAHLAASGRSLGAVAAMAAAVFGMRSGVLDPLGIEHPFLRLALSVLAGAVVYPTVHLALWRWQGFPSGIERRAWDSLAPAVRRARGALG